jgi:hypothetical protein
MLYRIKSVQEFDFESNDYLYWNNDMGWVDQRSATHFSKAEREKFGLPIGGFWEEV